MWRECWRTCVVLISVWLETIWMFCRDEKRLWWTHNMAAGRRAVLSLQRRWTVSESTEKLSVSSSPPPDNWGIDKLRVSGDIDKCGTEGLVPDGEDGCQRENRSTSTRSSTPHLPRVFSILGFSIFSLLFTFFHTHLSSPLFLLSRPARAPHINRLWLIRCKCEMHKKNQRWPKLEALCANSWAQPCRDEQAEQAEADDATWGYISRPVILVKYKETSTNPGRRYTQ